MKLEIIFSVLLLIVFQDCECQQIKNIKSSSVGTASVTLTWDKVSTASTTYTIKYFISPQSTWPAAIEKISTNSYKLENLNSGTTYGVFVEVWTGSETEPTGTSATITFQTDGPKPVKEFRIGRISAKEVDISWTPDTEQVYDGFIVVLFKVHDVLSDNKTEVKREVVDKHTRKYTVTKLQPSTGYRVGVIGKFENKVSTIKANGFGSSLEILAPTNLHISDHALFSAALNWIKPTTPVDHYEIEYKKVAEGATVKVIQTGNEEKTTQKLQDLDSSTLYAVRIRGVRITSMGDWSDWISFSTNTEVPFPAPQNLKLLKLNNLDTAIIGWDAVSTDVKHSFSHYLVKFYEMDTRPTKPIETVDTTYNLVGLRSGTTYLVSIQAVSTSGLIGHITTALSFLTIGPKPVAENPSISEITDKSAVVSWVTVSDSTHDYVEVHLFESLPRKQKKMVTLRNNETSYAFTGLTSNTGYAVEIYTVATGGKKSSAVKHGFRSSLSQSSLSHVLQCTNNVDKENLGSSKLTCDKIPNESVIEYETRIVVKESPSLTRNQFAKIQHTASDLVSVKQEIVVTGLYSGYTYEVYVRPIFAGNINGTETTAIQFNIPHGRPPTFIDITEITNSKGLVTWLNPYADEPSKIFQYEITYKSLSDPTGVKIEPKLVDHDKERKFEIKGLKQSHVYEVAISTKLQGETQNGTAIVKAFKTRLGQPPSPAYPRITIKDGQATFDWQLVPGRGDIKKYEVHIDRADGLAIKEISGRYFYTFYTSGALQNTFMFPKQDLDTGVTYQARVRGIVTANEAEKDWLLDGQWSTTYHFVIPKDDGSGGIFDRTPPLTQIAHISTTALVIQWHQRSNVLHFEVVVTAELSGQSGEQIEYKVSTAGINTQVTVNNLAPGKNYFYKIRAIGPNNEASLWSARNIFTTSGSSDKTSSSGLSDGVIAGIIVAVLLIFILVIIGVIIMRQRKKAQFNRFGNAVQFSRNGDGQMNDGHTEMDDPAQTAIKKGNKLYV